MTSSLFQCQHCGGYNGYRSRAKTFAEKFILPLLFLRTVRCGDCHKRSVQTFLVQVQERHESKSARSAVAGG